ncbi:hypothetical protein [Carboxylicivirga sp. N1Y90]|uniref:hypothetical protein n=1 Tax=Carboxylicivirga fragile TaxID=3417571 RepID=UPI003D352F3D|nr:hypothetical protein [Marinilabiliaceae bacterium N1Y90]
MKKSNKYIAGLTLPLLFVGVLVNLSFTPNTDNLMADGTKIKPGKRKATLVLSDGRKVELSGASQLIYTNVDGINIKTDSTGLVYQNEVPSELKKQNKTTETKQITPLKEEPSTEKTKEVTQ